VIHYGGHADAGTEALMPALLLAADRERGRLDAREIASLKLRAPVVVLAACATAEGTIHKTEGTTSLARAFLAAGAPSVIATLWPIDDGRAAPLFIRLHQAMTAGARPADALRSVQLEFIRGAAAGPHSLTWASIQSIGS
jgi:CHAT domain-containing protein